MACREILSHPHDVLVNWHASAWLDYRCELFGRVIVQVIRLFEQKEPKAESDASDADSMAHWRSVQL